MVEIIYDYWSSAATGLREAQELGNNLSTEDRIDTNYNADLQAATNQNSLTRTVFSALTSMPKKGFPNPTVLGDQCSADLSAFIYNGFESYRNQK